MCAWIHKSKNYKDKYNKKQIIKSKADWKNKNNWDKDRELNQSTTYQNNNKYIKIHILDINLNYKIVKVNNLHYITLCILISNNNKISS
jgi:hypothetical protein